MISATRCVEYCEELRPGERPELFCCLLVEEAEIRTVTSLPVYAFPDMNNLTRWVGHPVRKGRRVGVISPTRFAVVWRNAGGTIDSRRIDR